MPSSATPQGGSLWLSISAADVRSSDDVIAFEGHFMSGGYHPVFMEKWHDMNACTDVVWVNQTWWLESELLAHRDIWTRSYPEPALTDAISPDPVRTVGFKSDLFNTVLS